RGVPRMSRTLLAKRLRQLEDEGLVERDERDGTPHYRLTAAGRELAPVIETLGRWGARWIDSLADDDLDPAFLMWDVHRSIDRDA
ncbi:MAG: transcriptional regulator, partial [Actinobacteria bacterium]|nr:winged helix-turn-helix transcriptional regulator [Actinomycetota bacterium]NIS35280.1 winged helix-turn-helix transcriptional regulator [Actinomycetota bacterium]NIU69985.1 winged helix-turn-helix transcriptional regulator [Actinomycetota bacterium]NIV89738.1 transcriptional regulator [Actinomycetota bacterium]NIW31859.1 transcriptional regulator [Actinomycetota bacterium]